MPLHRLFQDGQGHQKSGGIHHYKLAEIKALARAGETVTAPKGFGQVEGHGTKPTDLEDDKKILKEHILEFSQLWEDFDSHPYFDKMDSEKWTALAIYHLDHHLKQFGA